MSTFNFLKEGEEIKDNYIIEDRIKDNVRVYKIEDKIIGIYSLYQYSDNFFNNCKIGKYKLIYNDGPVKYEFPKLKCKESKIIIYDML